MLEPVEAIERPVFPRVSPEAAALGNNLLSRETGFGATIMNEERRFTISMQMAALETPGLVVRCRVGDCDAMISVSDDQLHDLLSKLAADIAIRELPDTLIMAVAETALRPLLAGLASSLNLPFSLDRVEDNTPADWVAITVRDGIRGNGASVAAIHVSPDGLNVLTRMLDAAPTVNAWRQAESVLVKIDARFWCTAMTAGDLADLACGDVVLLPQDYPPDRVLLAASDTQAVLGTGRRNGSAVTVEELKGHTHGRP